MLPFDLWQAERVAALTAENGWLNLTDRVEFSPGRQSVGAGLGQEIVLSVGPEHLGFLTLGPEGAVLETPEAALPFQPQAEGGPQLVHAGLILEIHTVAGQPALRVRLIDRPARLEFSGLRSFAFDPAWVIRARWEKLAEPLRQKIALKGGAQDAVTLTHRAVFQHEGSEIALTPTHWKAKKPMFVIRDATSGRKTFAAARFLIGEDAGAAEITLDFNRAFNPPNAFTDLGICPLPPPGNILPFAIRAGELAPMQGNSPAPDQSWVRP